MSSFNHHHQTKDHHKQTCNRATLRSFSVKKIVVRMKNVKFRGKKTNSAVNSAAKTQIPRHSAGPTYNTLQTSQPSYIRQLVTIQPPGSTRSSSYLSLSRPPVSSSLKFCNHSFVYAAPALWNGLPKDLRQFAHPPNRALNFTYPPLALSSATFHSRLKTELFKISYPGSTPEPRHVRHHLLLQP